MARLDLLSLPEDLQRQIQRLNSEAYRLQSDDASLRALYESVSQRLRDQPGNPSLDVYLDEIARKHFPPGGTYSSITDYNRSNKTKSSLQTIYQNWCMSKDDIASKYSPEMATSTPFLHSLASISEVLEKETAKARMDAVAKLRLDRKEKRPGVSRLKPWTPADASDTLKLLCEEQLSLIRRRWDLDVDHIRSTFSNEAINNPAFLKGLNDMPGKYTFEDIKQAVRTAASRSTRGKDGMQKRAPLPPRHDHAAIVEAMDILANPVPNLAQSPMNSLMTPSSSRSEHVHDVFDMVAQPASNKTRASSQPVTPKPYTSIKRTLSIDDSCIGRGISERKVRRIDFRDSSDFLAPPSLKATVTSRSSSPFEYARSRGIEDEFEDSLRGYSDGDDSDNWIDDEYQIRSSLSSPTDQRILPEVSKKSEFEIVSKGKSVEEPHMQEQRLTITPRCLKQDLAPKSPATAQSQERMVEIDSVAPSLAADVEATSTKSFDGSKSVKNIINLTSPELDSSSSPAKLSGTSAANTHWDQSTFVGAYASLAPQTQLNDSVFQLILGCTSTSNTLVLDSLFSIPKQPSGFLKKFRRIRPRMIVMPMHHKNDDEERNQSGPDHWNLAIIIPPSEKEHRGQIEIWNSSKQASIDKNSCDRAKSLAQLISTPMTQWDEPQIMDCPKQDNAWDCGIHVIIFAWCRMSGCSIPDNVDGATSRWVMRKMLQSWAEINGLFFPTKAPNNASQHDDGKGRISDNSLTCDRDMEDSSQYSLIQILDKRSNNLNVAKGTIGMARELIRRAEKLQHQKQDEDSKEVETARQLCDARTSALASIQAMPTLLQEGMRKVLDEAVPQAHARLQCFEQKTRHYQCMVTWTSRIALHLDRRLEQLEGLMSLIRTEKEAEYGELQRIRSETAERKRRILERTVDPDAEVLLHV